jgi:Bacterial Ig-like domain (group 2)/Galactose oxidase, central domain
MPFSKGCQKLGCRDGSAVELDIAIQGVVVVVEKRDVIRANQRLAQPNNIIAYLVLGLTAAFALAACGGESPASQSTPPPPETFTAKSGVAQKGPLIKGATITAQELGSSLSPTGKQYSYQTISDLGNFSPTSTFGSRYIGLIATGYYFDELANAVSTGPITLNGYSDLSVDSALNVNLLTTLTYQRIQNLVTKSNMTFGAARTQAESEVLTALGIPSGSYGSFGTLDLSGDSDGDQILAAVSSIFVYGNSSGPLSSLIANFQNDVGTNGVITTAATKSALNAAAKALNPAVVAANLTQAYSSVGVVFTAANISDWIDQDGDGVIGKFKFQVADATPSSVFTFPSFVVTQVAGTSVSVTVGQLSVNGNPASGAAAVSAGDVITVSPGAGTFPNGVVTAYLLTGGNKIARVSFVSGLLSISVTPATPSIPKGLTQQFTAMGNFSDTSTADLTQSVVWTSGTPAIATVGTTTGLCTSVAVGSTVITATSGSVSGSASLTITSAIVESISIAPNPALSGIGLSQPFTATATYSDSTTTNVTKIATWTSSSPIATVGPTTGVATGVALGSTTISATIGTVTSTAALSIVTTSWFPTGNLVAARESQTATLLPSGLVLAAGGASALNGAPIASAELYDPAAATWSPTSSMSTPRFGHTATLLSNGMVLVVGGTNVAPPSGQTLPVLASAELYNPVTGAWLPTGSMSTARSGHTATALKNGLVLVEGGSGTTSAELYDPAAGTWSATGSTSNAHYGETATLLPNGNVLVAGTYGGNPLANNMDTSELYNTAAGTWSAAGSMSTPRFFHTATLLSNGSVLVVGGSNAAFVLTGSAELYDPNTATWSPAGSLSIPREGHTATLLSNGMVLVAGGNSPLQQGINTYYPPVASTELYDPAASTWTLSAGMSTARASHSSMLLQNDVVLVEGGDAGNMAGALASAEVYW